MDRRALKELIGEMVIEEDIKNALKAVKYPGYSRDIVSFGLVKEVAVNNGAVSLTMQLTGGSAEVAQQIKTESERVLKALAGVEKGYVEVRHQGKPAAAGARRPLSQQDKSARIRPNGCCCGRK